MSTGRANRWASPNTVSRCPFGSRSIADGSSPPTTSAPARSASSMSPTVPGRHSRPHWGKATISTSTMPAKRSRVASTPSTLLTPTCGSTSTWLRMCVVPAATDWTTWRADWTQASSPSSCLRRRSLAIVSAIRGPPEWGCQGWPRKLLSRWACASTNPGRAMAPAPFSRESPAASSPRPTEAIRPARISKSTSAPPIGRTRVSSDPGSLVGISRHPSRPAGGLCPRARPKPELVQRRSARASGEGPPRGPGRRRPTIPMPRFPLAWGTMPRRGR
jgi:hypothetical protein